MDIFVLRLSDWPENRCEFLKSNQTSNVVFDKNTSFGIYRGHTVCGLAVALSRRMASREAIKLEVDRDLAAEKDFWGPIGSCGVSLSPKHGSNTGFSRFT